MLNTNKYFIKNNLKEIPKIVLLIMNIPHKNQLPDPQQEHCQNTGIVAAKQVYSINYSSNWNNGICQSL